MEKYKFLEHTADVKFQSFGKTIEEAFTNAALALAETMTKNKKIKSKMKWDLDVSGKDYEAMLYDFLEEFLFLFDSENFILSEIKKIEIVNEELHAEVMGDLVSNYKITNDVKAITYHQMFVKQNKDTGLWVCQVVLDV